MAGFRCHTVCVASVCVCVRGRGWHRARAKYLEGVEGVLTPRCAVSELVFALTSGSLPKLPRLPLFVFHSLVAVCRNGEPPQYNPHRPLVANEKLDCEKERNNRRLKCYMKANEAHLCLLHDGHNNMTVWDFLIKREKWPLMATHL